MPKHCSTANTGAVAVSQAANWFKVTLQDSLGATEIAYVRSRSDGSAVMSNLLRGQDGTTAIAFAAGSVCSVRVTAMDMQSPPTASNLSGGEAGAVPYQAGPGVTAFASDPTQLPSWMMPFPAGTRLPFAQSAAPAGWTQDTSDNADNRMLRVVKTSGNGVGGSHSPVLNNVVPSHTHVFMTGNVSSDHSHVDQGHIHSNGAYNANAGQYLTGGSPILIAATGVGYANLAGANANHTHSGTTNANGSASNWTPRYIDLIICSKN